MLTVPVAQWSGSRSSRHASADETSFLKKCSQRLFDGIGCRDSRTVKARAVSVKQSRGSPEKGSSRCSIAENELWRSAIGWERSKDTEALTRLRAESKLPAGSSSKHG